VSAPRRSQPLSPFHQALGEALTAMRNDAELTVEQFADCMKMRFQLLSDLERGVTDTKLSTLVRLSENAEIELSELMARAEKLR
jgi:transcriptional regulator with XRE-family HTH domain